MSLLARPCPIVRRLLPWVSFVFWTTETKMQVGNRVLGSYPMRRRRGGSGWCDAPIVRIGACCPQSGGCANVASWDRWCPPIPAFPAPPGGKRGATMTMVRLCDPGCALSCRRKHGPTASAPAKREIYRPSTDGQPSVNLVNVRGRADVGRWAPVRLGHPGTECLAPTHLVDEPVAVGPVAPSAVPAASPHGRFLRPARGLD